MTERIGLLGGTFDPPHMAHLILGEYTTDALGLSQMLFLPAADPPHKRDDIKLSVEHRMAMLELALRGNPRFAISRVDIDRPGPHYSADAVSIVQEQYPDAELFFVMGSDSLHDLLQWHRPDLLIERCQLAVMRRPGVPVDPAMHEAELPGLAERVTMVDAPLLEISSTLISERVVQGRSIRYLVPDSVFTYIHDNKLYQ